MAPLQALEVGKLKKRISDFENKQQEFRKSFQKMRFYQFKCRQPYELLAEANGMIDAMEVEMKVLRVSVYSIFYLFIYLFVCLFIYLFIYLFVCLFVCLFVYLFLHFID